MREADEQRSGEQQHQGALADAAHEGERTTHGDGARFSSQGPLPAVAASGSSQQPSASDLAYGDALAFAPQKPADKIDEVKSTPQLLIDFGTDFPEAEKLIKANPPAMKFVRESAADGVRFGGYAEKGPLPSASAYTSNKTVYIPQAHTDGLHAMSDFLFELNNGVRAPRFDVLRKEAAKGAKGTLTSESYARKVVELEVEGMLKLGGLWLDMKRAAGKENDRVWTAEDHHFYLQQYKDFQAGRKTKDAIVTEVLHSRYTEGHGAGKTVEENYKEQYDSIAERGPG